MTHKTPSPRLASYDAERARAYFVVGYSLTEIAILLERDPEALRRALQRRKLLRPPDPGECEHYRRELVLDAMARRVLNPNTRDEHAARLANIVLTHTPEPKTAHTKEEPEWDEAAYFAELEAEFPRIPPNNTGPVDSVDEPLPPVPDRPLEQRPVSSDFQRPYECKSLAVSSHGPRQPMPATRTLAQLDVPRRTRKTPQTRCLAPPPRAILRKSPDRLLHPSIRVPKSASEGSRR